MRLRESDLDVLLSRGEIAGPSYDRILEAAVSAAKPARAQRRWWRATLALAGAAGVAGALFLALGRDPELGFHAKGGGSLAPKVSVRCIGGRLDACPIGSRLLFAVTDVARQVRLNAFAVAEGTGEHIWYFEASQQSPEFAARPGTQVSPREIVIGPEHVPGAYQIVAVLSPQALSREVLREAPSNGAISLERIPLVIVRR